MMSCELEYENHASNFLSVLVVGVGNQNIAPRWLPFSQSKIGHAPYTNRRYKLVLLALLEEANAHGLPIDNVLSHSHNLLSGFLVVERTKTKTPG
jgi:hypothetical protein